MRAQQARKLLESEQAVQRARRELMQAENRRNALRERLLPELLEATGFTKAGGIEIKVTECRQRQLFDLTGYMEHYGVTARMRQFMKLSKRSYSWTVRHAGGAT